MEDNTREVLETKLENLKMLLTYLHETVENNSARITSLEQEKYKQEGKVESKRVPITILSGVITGFVLSIIAYIFEKRL
jgi:ABC-type transporter Mla maintaining outer membrane lipid asymmetry permease subunit MlaE